MYINTQRLFLDNPNYHPYVPLVLLAPRQQIGQRNVSTVVGFAGLLVVRPSARVDVAVTTAQSMPDSRWNSSDTMDSPRSDAVCRSG